MCIKGSREEETRVQTKRKYAELRPGLGQLFSGQYHVRAMKIMVYSWQGK